MIEHLPVVWPLQPRAVPLHVRQVRVRQRKAALANTYKDVSARHSSAKLRKRAGLLTPFPQPPRRALWPWLGSRAAGLCRRVSVSDSSPRMAVLLAGMGAHPRRSHGRRPAHTAHATLSASESATAGSRLTILTLRQRSRGRDATSMVPAISTNDEMVMMIVVLVLVRMMI